MGNPLLLRTVPFRLWRGWLSAGVRRHDSTPQMAADPLRELDDDATSYVQAHALEDCLSAAVDAAIRSKPENPLTFIAKHLLSQGDSGEPEPRGSPSAPGTQRTSEGLGAGRSDAGRGRRRPLKLELHAKARSQENPDYPQRLAVSDEQCRWAAEWPSYMPPLWTHKVVVANDRDLPTGHKWADPSDQQRLRSELEERTTFATEGGVGECLRDAIDFDSEGCPLNPVGRTGMRGRGLLGKWGPNHAADPIVTRFHPTNKQLQVCGRAFGAQLSLTSAPADVAFRLPCRRRSVIAARPLVARSFMPRTHTAECTMGGPACRALHGFVQVVVIQRKDNGQWAIPGGMVDAGESVSVTVKREFAEETGNLPTEEERAEFKRLLDDLFANGKQVPRTATPVSRVGSLGRFAEPALSPCPPTPLPQPLLGARHAILHPLLRFLPPLHSLPTQRHPSVTPFPPRPPVVATSPCTCARTGSGARHDPARARAHAWHTHSLVAVRSGAGVPRVRR